VRRWIEERLSSMRLTEAERRSWQGRFEDLRKEGMGSLSGLQQAGSCAGFERCAVCDAANEACERR